MDLNLILKIIILFMEISLSIVLFSKWGREEVKFISDLPFLFGVSILLIGVGGAVSIVYTLAPFTTELIAYEIRGVILCFTAAAMLIGILKIWLVDRPKTIITISVGYSILFLILIFISTTPEQIVALTSPLIGANVLLIIITFSIAYYKKRLSTINTPLIVIGSVILLIGQLTKIFLNGSGVAFIPDIISVVGWVFFASGFLTRAPYYREIKLPKI